MTVRKVMTDGKLPSYETIICAILSMRPLPQDQRYFFRVANVKGIKNE